MSHKDSNKRIIEVIMIQVILIVVARRSDIIQIKIPFLLQFFGWRRYLDAFYRRGAPPQAHNPLHFRQQRNWWWRGRGPPDHRPHDVPSHGVCTHLHPHRHRHPRRTTPRRPQGYVNAPLPARSSFPSRRAPQTPNIAVAVFLRVSCKSVIDEVPGITVSNLYIQVNY